ncbi:microsomal triglyceride transfer protein large subunit isoform X1 [Belonocnema kinseyi]|uniref:microsomal triglyceride transfer protein large subunit isoform X1 n=2 Tax=Belonocnema kinseyi TaxID=2817044 RepID=UPI00143D94B7|nr:microsomal triglyceride transfer protein large subunit isoform X1 [Belonocnema kinseyi]
MLCHKTSYDIKELSREPRDTERIVERTLTTNSPRSETRVRSLLVRKGRRRGKMAYPARKSLAVTVYVLCLLALFGSYCQMAPAVAGATRGWNLGHGLRYEFTTTLIFREAGPPRPGGDVGFQMTGQLEVVPVWQDPKDPDTIILKIKLVSPHLWIKSRKAPEPEGFVQHTSRLPETSSKPILVVWKNGKIQSIFTDPNDSVSSLNLKRGLASLFQYTTFDGEVQEKDASGLCRVVYTSLGPSSVEKRKISCQENNLPPRVVHPNPIFGIKLTSSRNCTYDLSPSLLPLKIREQEIHVMHLVSKPEVGSAVTSQRVVWKVDEIQGSTVEAESVKNAIILLEPGFRDIPIDLQIELMSCPDSGCSTLEQTVQENRDALDTSVLGTAKSASAFLKLISLVREASSEELVKLLKSIKYRQLRPQLWDILGSASTPAAHQAAMKILKQDEIGDDTERYLWSLSFSPTPDPEIIKDVLRRSEETIQNDKVSETLALTAAAMAKQHGSPSVIEKARVSLELGLDSCTGEECQLKFLRALRNLESEAAVPALLNFALKGSKVTSAAAWLALGALPKQHISEDVRSAALKTFYQLGGPRRDSTVRTLALNLILENDPSVDDLQGFVQYLATRDLMYEVRKYLSQRLEQLSEKHPQFSKNLKEALRRESHKIYNYDVLALKGLSTAFTRSFLRSPRSNGSLVTVQEVNSGLLKRGVVDVVLESEPHSTDLFSLGLFAGGLGGFVSSEQEDNNVPADDEAATAGMEISLLGVVIRPFVFFSGQGELMGHVWSGTASERTPAFQALVNLHRYMEYVPLASGFVGEMSVEGAVSFDLAGQIQLSLWSRNAQSLVDMGAGVAIQGGTKVRTNFVQSTAEFLFTLEPKLELATDVDFAGPVSLCMRLTQPETIVRHHVYKIERIPGSRHRLRKTKRSRLFSPARSYLLNRKNNEMCSKVFS